MRTQVLNFGSVYLTVIVLLLACHQAGVVAQTAPPSAGKVGDAQLGATGNATPATIAHAAGSATFQANGIEFGRMSDIWSFAQSALRDRDEALIFEARSGVRECIGLINQAYE